MINNAELLTLTRVAAAMGAAAASLSGQDAKRLSAALDELNELLTASLQSRVATGQRLARATNGRPPSASYMIDVSNMAPRTVIGGQAAADAVNEVLAENGERQRVTANALSVGIARNGQWFRLVETSNGTIVVSVTKVKSA